MSDELKTLTIGSTTKAVLQFVAGAGITITADNVDPYKKIIAAVVSDLTDYYTKTEVDDLIGAIETGEFRVVSALPATGESNVIYLVPQAAPATGYNEYIWIEADSAYEPIGSTNIDLSGYYTSQDVDNLLADKVDKVTGKGLSANDYTTADKNKLDGIAAGAEVNVQSDWNQSNTAADDFIKNKPGNATTSAAGLMSAADKTKLDGIAARAEENVQSDWNQTNTAADDFIKNKPGNATTTTAGLMSAADKTKVDLLTGARLMWYGTSSTAAGTAAKVVTCPDFALSAGVAIAVKFTYAQTYNGQITMNVNSTGAKQVRDYGQFYDGYSKCAWDANQTMLFVYDGTYWNLLNGAIITGSELDALETALGI